MPNFHLSAAQRDAIGKALGEIEKPLPDRLQIQHTMTAFNCTACHTRDGAGGVSNAMFKHFGTDEEGLGNPGRIPPTLDGVGAKLRPEWLRKVLFDGETVRPYMHTRMPQFGEANLRHLPPLFEKVDSLPVVELPEPKREDRRRIARPAICWWATRALNCVACHNFNGKPSPGLKGLDLLNSFERLQPSWYAHFMRNPQKYRPGIVMPDFWPDGKAVRQDVLKGKRMSSCARCGITFRWAARRAIPRASARRARIWWCPIAHACIAAAVGWPVIAVLRWVFREA